MSESGLRPKGTVERQCDTCGWSAWYDPLSMEASADLDQIICMACRTNPMVTFKCTACNRTSAKTHLELAADHKDYATNCYECIAAGVKPREFAKEVYCWAHFDGERPIATQLKRFGGKPTRPWAWQTHYHVCDACAADWIHDLSEDEQKAALRKRGVRVTEHTDGSWSYGGRA